MFLSDASPSQIESKPSVDIGSAGDVRIALHGDETDSSIKDSNTPDALSSSVPNPKSSHGAKTHTTESEKARNMRIKSNMYCTKDDDDDIDR